MDPIFIFIYLYTHARTHAYMYVVDEILIQLYFGNMIVLLNIKISLQLDDFVTTYILV